MDNIALIDDICLEVGDIVLYKNSSGILSRLVRFFTKSKYSHASMMISQNLIIEANWYKKSNVIPFVFDNEKMEIYRVKSGLTIEQKLKLLEYSYSFLNKVYDYPQIIGYFIKFFNKKFNSNIFNSSKKLICSELIDRAYLKIGIDLSSLHFIGDITPEDISKSDKLMKIL